MGRKEGGSLFHQLIHAPGVMTLADRTASDGSEMEVSFKTRENYYSWLHKAADYFKGQGIRSIRKIGQDEVQAYADMLLDKGLSASTIHSYLSPVCKATGVELKEIEKPTRHASEFTRSSGGGKKYGGRPGELNELVGIPEDYRWQPGRENVPVYPWGKHAIWGLTGRTASAPPGPRRSWASPSPSTPTHR